MNSKLTLIALLLCFLPRIVYPDFIFQKQHTSLLPIPFGNPNHNPRFGSGRAMHEKALSAEKQGIARAYRLGLNHPLQIIRFYTRGTIEERVSRERTEL
jgi:hypothetical protein